MILGLNIRFCELMKDEDDFLIFGLEVITAYSSNIQCKRFEDFYKFHLMISYFWNQEVKNFKFLQVLMKLPGYCRDLESMRKKMQTYVSGLMKIIQCAKFNKFHPWIQIIHRFLNIKGIVNGEEEKAGKIQGLFKEFYLRKLKNKKTGFVRLDQRIVCWIFGFLGEMDLDVVKMVSKGLRNIVNQVVMVREIERMGKMCKEWRSVDLAQSELVLESTFGKLMNSCSPELLDFVSFEGCRNFGDGSLAGLASVADVEGKKFLLSDLNLSNCNLTDESVCYLKVFKNLKILKLKQNDLSDLSINSVICLFPCLETLDLSETLITSASLLSLSSSQLKTLIVKDCKNLKISDTLKSSSMKIISSSEDYTITLVHESTNQTIHIKGNNSIQVRDISSFISSKISTTSEVIIKHNSKELKKYLHIITLPQENSSITLSFNLIQKPWQGLPTWTDKKSATYCSCCEKRFMWLSRKINCRHCGQVFCKSCTSHSVFIEKFCYTVSKVPVCQKCFEIIINYK